DANKWAQQTEAAIREGRHFKTVEAKRHTVEEMIDRYIKSVLPTKGSQKENQKTQLEWWKKQIGSYTLADCTPSLIAECRDELLQGITHLKGKRSPATVNRFHAALSHCFTIAVKEWGWLDDSPMRKVRKCKEPRGRVRFLSDDERGRLLKACEESENKTLYPIVVLALSTGARQAEILTLRWDQIDLNRGVITLYETKNKEIRSLPLAGHALKLFKDLNKVRRIDTDLLFPGRDKKQPADIRHVWITALEKAKIENFRFHDLRHSAASYLAMNGATIAEIAEVLGHRVRLEMSRPHGLELDIKLPVEGKEYTVNFVNTGVPHVIKFVQELENYDAQKMGKAIRMHPHFQPAGANVNFIVVHDRSNIYIRTYERGVEDETLACGTGAVAAALISSSSGQVDSPVNVKTTGGSILTIHFEKDGSDFKKVFLEGEARVVYEGQLWEEGWR
ncbi:MAG: integrase family protein, partial [Deltaproteobacteria bacterium]|nr:integrase family protein [Deltaproteobacteria bacterium]